MLAAIMVSDVIIYVFASLQPDFIALYVSQLREQIQNIPAESMDEAGREAARNSLKDISLITQVYMAGVYAWQSVQIGFFISVIISVILRHQPKNQ